MNELELKSLPLTVKAVEGDNPNGEFEAILSTSDVDREGETVAAGAFEPLPSSIPIHFDHDFLDKVPPVGRGVPFYEGDTLKVRGTFASTPRAQELRSLVNEGVIDSMSAGFITTKRKGKSVLTGDLIEGSLTATPVNRGAMLVRSKTLHDLKAGARNSKTDQGHIQAAHDSLVSAGADCTSVKSLKALDGSYEDLSEDITEALVEASTADIAAKYPNSDPGEYQWLVNILGTFPDHVVYRIGYDDDDAMSVTYTVDGDTVTLGTPEPVTVEQVVTPATKSASTASGSAADQAADPDAEVDEETALALRARALVMTAEAAAV